MDIDKKFKIDDENLEDVNGGFCFSDAAKTIAKNTQTVFANSVSPVGSPVKSKEQQIKCSKCNNLIKATKKYHLVNGAPVCADCYNSELC